MEPASSSGDAAVSRRYLPTPPPTDESTSTLPLPTTTPTQTTTSAFPLSPSTWTYHTFIPDIDTLTPSFFHNITSPPRLRPTGWIDGLRGIAAFLVLIFHFTYRMTNTNLAWGADDIPETHVLWRLPVLRLLTSGSAMVAMFFLISGYALALRPLQLVRSAQRSRGDGIVTPTTEFTRQLASAIIRRPIRLFAPVVLSTCLIFVLVRLGFWNMARPTAKNTHIFPITPQETHVESESSIFAQLVHVWIELRDLMHNSFWENFFGGNFEYDQHMWTIPVELRSSFLLFGSLVPCVFMAQRLRYLYWAGLVGWCLDGGNWQMVLFYTGALVAEWNLAIAERAETSLTREKGTLSTPETPLLVLVSLLVLSYPEDLADKTPLYRYLSWLSYPSFGQDFRFWQCLGGGVLFATISTSPVLRKPLESSSVQYLGRISYGLYLMHGPVIHTVGFGVVGLLHGDSEEHVGTIEYLVALTVTTACAIWAGDVWWRAVDMRAVKWARQVSDYMLSR